jgi:hypothetical protein
MIHSCAEFGGSSNRANCAGPLSFRVGLIVRASFIESAHFFLSMETWGADANSSIFANGDARAHRETQYQLIPPVNYSTRDVHDRNLDPASAVDEYPSTGSSGKIPRARYKTH